MFLNLNTFFFLLFDNGIEYTVHASSYVSIMYLCTCISSLDQSQPEGPRVDMGISD